MIPVLRVALGLLAGLLAYLFGGTMERFLIEIVRTIVPLDSSNAFTFNLVYMILSVLPLFLAGLVLSISIGGEPASKRKLWSMVGGMVLGLIVFRGYQMWWIFRGALGEDSISWTESLTPVQLYFLEKVLPYGILGIFSTLFVFLLRRDWSEKAISGGLTLAGTFVWLAINHKLQNIQSFSQIGCALLISVFAAALSLFIIEKSYRIILN